VRAVPLHLGEANNFVAQHHRHNLPTVGGKFAVGAADDTGKVIGVAIAGRPVCRRLEDVTTLEVLRVCTDGTPNACSFLYARTAKIARLMGYERIITYTLTSESGASLRAVPEDRGSDLPTGITVDAGRIHEEVAGAFSGTRFLGLAMTEPPSFPSFYRGG
jgi:hypothetical protein